MTGNRPPAYVGRFADLLGGIMLDRIELALPRIEGHWSILSAIRYNDQPWNHLNRHHEYTFYVAQKRIELSMELPKRNGPLRSLNLTLPVRQDSRSSFVSIFI